VALDPRDSADKSVAYLTPFTRTGNAIFPIVKATISSGDVQMQWTATPERPLYRQATESGVNRLRH
jgi:hypothetical protein